MHIAIILGSTRPKYRLGDRVATWVMHEISKYPEAECKLLDIKKYDLPFFFEDQGPRGNTNRQIPENVQSWLADVAWADGYLIITAEYNAGPTAALKNALDLIGTEMRRKAAGIISYSDGGNGGMYAPIQLRTILNELEVTVIPQEHIITKADQAIHEDGTAYLESQEYLERRFKRLMDNLLWYIEALTTARRRE